MNTYDVLKLQKKAARLILNKDYNTPSTQLFTELQWMPIQDRINYHRCIQVYKCTKGPCPDKLQNIFTPASAVHSHHTRSAVNNNLHVGPKYVKSFDLGAVAWNKLSTTLKKSKNLNSF